MDVLTADVIGDIVLVLVLASLCGAAARRLGQPTVVGQIIAGIVLGPSLLGRLPGHLTSRLFPHTALASLTILSQVAVVIFMFVVGYELDRPSTPQRYRVTLLLAASALLVPMGLGSTAAVVFRSSFAALGQQRVGGPFILFLGVATSITALPVLASVVRERGLAGTTAANLATSAAGLMDVAAWLALAAALAGTTQRPGRPWPVTLLLIAGFAAVMLLAVRPAVRWWIGRPQAVLSSKLPVALTLALGSAWITTSLGLHPIFGGFLAGLTMPRTDGAPDADVLRSIDEVGRLFLPLFFAVTGLSVDIAASTSRAWILLALLFAIAVTGKIVPAYAASRLGKLPPRDAATVAVLVNTRGLTELIALNVGFTAGLVGQRLFSALVLMAVATTVMTAPLLELIRSRSALPGLAESTVQPTPPGTA
jgi:Kef-type K+ transport system membrane component KefB